MQVRLPGPVDVVVDGEPQPVRGLRRKAVLAVLALQAGEVVSTDRLTDVICYERAIALSRDLADRFNEADTLSSLGDVHHSAGDTGAAHRAWGEAMRIFGEIDHPDRDKVRAKLRAPSGRRPWQAVSPHDQPGPAQPPFVSRTVARRSHCPAVAP
jgi:hypothetical protein